jgi:hypothetical protein
MEKKDKPEQRPRFRLIEGGLSLNHRVEQWLASESTADYLKTLLYPFIDPGFELSGSQLLFSQTEHRLTQTAQTGGAHTKLNYYPDDLRQYCHFDSDGYETSPLRAAYYISTLVAASTARCDDDEVLSGLRPITVEGVTYQLYGEDYFRCRIASYAAEDFLYLTQNEPGYDKTAYISDARRLLGSINKEISSRAKNKKDQNFPPPHLIGMAYPSSNQLLEQEVYRKSDSVADDNNIAILGLKRAGQKLKNTRRNPSQSQD